jgi:hypothetical protein
MTPRDVAFAGLVLAACAPAQEAPAAAAAPVAVRTRVLSIRDIPLPAKSERDMSLAISRDGRRLVVSISAYDASAADEFMMLSGPLQHAPQDAPQHPSTYLYDVEADKTVELRPVFEGKTWRLVGKAAISPDGRFVAAACAPEAEDAVLNKSHFTRAIALVDTTGDESRLIDLRALGVQRLVWPEAPSLSLNAECLAFSTSPDVDNANHHSWTMLWSPKDGLFGAVVLDDEYDGTFLPRISEDGRFLLVDAWSDHPDTRPSGPFLMDLQANLPGVTPAWPEGRTKLVGRAGSLSGDGRRVAFLDRDPRAAGEGPLGFAVFLYDDANRSTTLVSGDPGDEPPRTISFACSLSGSGTYVAYDKLVTRTAGDQESSAGICVRELGSGRTARLDADPAPGATMLGVASMALSGDGRRLAFIHRLFHHSSGLFEPLAADSTSSEIVLADIDWNAASPPR